MLPDFKAIEQKKEKLKKYLKKRQRVNKYYKGGMVLDPEDELVIEVKPKNEEEK